MFSEIGVKIKSLAGIISIAGSVISFIGAMVFFIASADSYSDELFVAGGVITLVAGILGSVIYGFILYGFGELIERVCSIDDKLNKGSKKEESPKLAVNTVKKKTEAGNVAMKTPKAEPEKKVETVESETMSYDDILSYMGTPPIGIDEPISNPKWEKEIEAMTTEQLLNKYDDENLSDVYRSLCYRELINRPDLKGILQGE